MDPATLNSLNSLGALEALSGVAGGIAEIGGGIAGKRQADDNARFLRRIGEIEADEDRRQVRGLIGRQRVAQAKSGIDPGVGSAVDVVASTAAEGELRALRTAFGFELDAVSEEQVGDALLISGILKGSKTILGGIGREANRRSTTAGRSTSPTSSRSAAGIGLLPSDLNRLRR